VNFNIEQAKQQVNAVPKLALPYFLDACDEIEKLRTELEQAEDQIIRLQHERPITSGYGEVQ
jgi:hypothetical protein